MLFFCKKGQLEQVYHRVYTQNLWKTVMKSPEFGQKKWWDLPGLNQRPSDYESPALTTELRSLIKYLLI